MFTDRDDAGRRLGSYLAGRSGLVGARTVVLGLPRGGVVVAARVAQALDAPLDVVCVRKLRAPRQPELALGALGEDGVRVVEGKVRDDAGITPLATTADEQTEARRLSEQAARLRQGRATLDLTGRLAVLVDDGVATGSTARAACQVVRRRGAARVLLAVPVGPVGMEDRIPEADEVVSLHSPQPFGAVSQHYRHFDQVSEDAVLAELDTARRS